MYKVLIIDDEINNCLLLTEILEDYPLPIEVLTAESGDLGIKIALDQKPDLIFVDRMLPVIDGLEVCRRIKQDRELGDTAKLVIISALKSTIDETKNYADAYIQKPYRSADIFGILDKILSD